MKIINAKIAEQNLIIEPSVLSVAKSVNAYSLKIEYDEEWDGVDSKVVTFRGANGVAIGISDNGENGGVVIPWEVIQCCGKVTVGVVGYKGTELKLTTTGLYDRNTFVVLPASFGLVSAMTPTPDIYQKLLQTIGEANQKIGNLSDLETEAKDNLVAAINEVLDGGGSGTVTSVNQVLPDEDGNVQLSPSDLGAASDIRVANLETALATEVNARSTADTALQNAINAKQDALSATQLNAINSGIDSTKVAQITSNSAEIDGIEAKIPAQASSSNQLADKDFVNSSVATNTANYISDNGQPFASLSALEAYTGTLTNNDYAFVVGTDTTGNTTYTRYKYNASEEEWAGEYVLNNSSFTADQWAAINSGITSGDVTKLAGITAGAEPNTIDSISVNGVAQTPDANKNVNLTIESGIKSLTTEDYNWPTDNPTMFRADLAEPGIYMVSEEQVGSFVFLECSYFSSRNLFAGDVFVKTGTQNANSSRTLVLTREGVGTWQGSVDTRRSIATTVRNNLTSTSTSEALSAAQGKVLNDRLTTAEEQLTGLASALNIINNGTGA